MPQDRPRRQTNRDHSPRSDLHDQEWALCEQVWDQYEDQEWALPSYDHKNPVQRLRNVKRVEDVPYSTEESNWPRISQSRNRSQDENWTCPTGESTRNLSTNGQNMKKTDTRGLNNKSQRSKGPCVCCGADDHARKQCEFRRTVCSLCHTQGHVSGNCRKSGYGLNNSRPKSGSNNTRGEGNVQDDRNQMMNGVDNRWNANEASHDWDTNNSGWNTNNVDDGWNTKPTSFNEFHKKVLCSKSIGVDQQNSLIDAVVDQVVAHDDPEITLEGTHISKLSISTPTYTYDRHEMNHLRNFYGADHWMAILHQKAAEPHRQGWDIDEEPFELDPNMRIPFNLQLRVQREKEKAERRRVQEEKHKQEEEKQRLLDEVRKILDSENVVYGKLRTTPWVEPASLWPLKNCKWPCHEEFEKWFKEECEKVKKEIHNGTYDPRPLLWPHTKPNEYKPKVTRVSKLLKEDNEKRLNKIKQLMEGSENQRGRNLVHEQPQSSTNAQSSRRNPDYSNEWDRPTKNGWNTIGHEEKQDGNWW